MGQLYEYALDRTIILGHCVDKTFTLNTGQLHLDTVDETVTFKNSRQMS